MAILFLNEVPDPVFIIDHAGQCLFANKASKVMATDHKKERIENLIPIIRDASNRPESSEFKYAIDGIDYLVSIKKDINQFTSVMTTWKRLSARDDNQRAISERVFESCNDGILICSTDFKVSKANPAMNELLHHINLDCESVVGKNIFDLFNKVLDIDHIASHVACNDKWINECEISIGEETLNLVFIVSQIKDQFDELINYLVMITDVTESHHNADRIIDEEYSSVGFPKLLFTEKVDEFLSTNKTCAMLFVDVDRFKEVNATLGHSDGDKVLQIIYDRISSVVRNYGVAIRFGADSFLIAIMAGDQRAMSYTLSSEIMDALRKTIHISNHELSMSCSVGISISGEHGINAETLIKNAEAAMRSVKINGRNKVALYEPSMNAHSMHKLYIESSLRKAMSQGDLVLYYQPQVDRFGKMKSMEALVRWSRHGIITSPAEFIHIAEESGMIELLGRWAIIESCRQILEWKDAGVEVVPVAVNISASHFKQHGFAEDVCSILNQYAIDPSLINIEITETSLLTDSEYVISTMEKLKSYGIGIAIDDFGTGYSSLSYLNKFKVDKIKIDQVFVRGALTNKTDLAIIVAMVGIAKSMNIGIVAEGVESFDLASVMYDHGCDLIQGYVYSKAVPADQIPELINTSF